jgi:tetratricopeptide (TPR) repeat protein
MTSSPTRHSWVVTPSDTLADGVLAPPPEPDLDVRCHRLLRGPYTGAGSLLRSIVPELLERDAELVGAHSTEVLAVAPELTDLVPSPPQTLTNLAVSEERTRFYAAGRTLRIAHGIAELVMDWARVVRPGGVVLSFRELGHADATDRELMCVLLRRCDPSLVTLVVEADGVTEHSPLAQALRSFADPASRHPVAAAPVAPGTELAQLFVDTDGTSQDPAVRGAYADLPPSERARRHTARAEKLAALDEKTLELGAIAYHHEHGTDPAGAGGDALLAALNHCFDAGFYDAAMDLALRGRRVVPRTERPKPYWSFTTRVAASLSYLDHGEDAIPYLAEMRRYTTEPELHMRCSYLMAMLYTRHLTKDAHDENLALEWVNTAIVIADGHPDPKRRVFVGAFMRNARALVELHRANLDGALTLVNEAIGMTDAELGTEEHMLHRSVLRHNRAQVLAALGDPVGALEDFDEVIRRDPDYAEYYFDRAGARRTAGLHAEALADYATAIRLSPPFHEAYYNRADLLRELGEDEGALHDLDYVLELDPDHVDALVNRAGTYLELGNVDGAGPDIEHGLALEPRNAHLLSALAALRSESGDAEGAWESYSAALQENPRLVEAWANRAVLSYTAGRVADAVTDLDHAIELGDDAALRVNRAIALQDLGDHRRALDDLAHAFAGADGPDVDPELLYRRGVSRYALHDVTGAHEDWRAHLAAYGEDDASPYAAEIRQLGGPGLLRASSTGNVA